jgi:hypothetical protein
LLTGVHQRAHQIVEIVRVTGQRLGEFKPAVHIAANLVDHFFQLDLFRAITHQLKGLQ